MAQTQQERSPTQVPPPSPRSRPGCHKPESFASDSNRYRDTWTARIQGFAVAAMTVLLVDGLNFLYPVELASEQLEGKGAEKEEKPAR